MRRLGVAVIGLLASFLPIARTGLISDGQMPDSPPRALLLDGKMRHR